MKGTGKDTGKKDAGKNTIAMAVAGKKATTGKSSTDSSKAKAGGKKTGGKKTIGKAASSPGHEVHKAAPPPPPASKEDTKKVVAPPPPPAPEEGSAIPKEIAMKELAEFMKHCPEDKWVSLVDRTKTTISASSKYMGALIIAWNAEEMTKEKLAQKFHGLVKSGSKLFFDFMDVKVDFLDYISKGVIPQEIFSPKDLKSKKICDQYKLASEDDFYPQKTGEVWFIFSDDKAVPDWAKEKTHVVIVNP